MKTATKRAIVGAAALILSVATLTGCSNGAGAGTGGAAGGTGGDAKSAKIGLLLPDSVTARYASADRPLFTAEVKNKCSGCSVVYANADGDASKQLQQAQSMLTQGVKVLVLDPFDGEAAASIVQQAKAKNVPVISYDRLIDSADLSYYISFDNEKVGELQGTALVDALKKKNAPAGAGIIMVNGSPTDNNASQFKAGAHKVIDASGYKVLAEYDTPGWDPAKAQDWASGQVSKLGADKITGVYAANDDTGGGVIAALKSAGVKKLPPVTGQDASLAGVQRILSGEQYMTVYKAFKPEASQAADLAVDFANGKKPSSSTTVKTKGGASVPATLLQPVAVTADNVESTVVKDGLYKVTDICTSQYAAACTAAGIK
ncbi:sugar ABC transporter substrate-binding protein [Curtobacterium sp. ISL-83]|uniref:sugar ABC transporter substrate-binding protein n=1 Tax=Curtobacterium sp. ISL-83 TaxID=2819145 RepID=UPI001BEC14D8|nr:sugar ABC transporter substrate-binding protein [Curtobacterium sp. ISL-83]MBT2501215.1 sugar ABC transporter substrate-binding protein [Curtobacterium sp. ISL-83]